MKEKHWLIVYDIRDLKRLFKVSKCMESFAWRVQKSVFETKATDETIGQLKLRLEKIIDTETDFILFFEVCERDWQKKEMYGKNIQNKNIMNIDDDFIIL